MTTKTLSTYIPAGYKLSPSYSELDITTTGGAGGTGVYSGHYATISNAGKINAAIYFNDGILLPQGGVVINRPTGVIGAGEGVFSGGFAVVLNYGTIASYDAAFNLNDGGRITNGGFRHEQALISGYIFVNNAAATLTNYGTVDGSVAFFKGGVVTNGDASDTAALIAGDVYLAQAVGTVSNFGTIHANSAAIGFQDGVDLGGGRVTNGAVSDTTARIDGSTAVLLFGPGTVSNFGTLDGLGAAPGADGVALWGGGSLTNGGGIDTSALVEGYTGVFAGGGAGTVVNFGTVEGLGVDDNAQFGVYFGAGGSVANGGATNRTALIEGANGVVIRGAGAISVQNFGTVLATGAYGVGVFVSGGTVTNGSLNNAGASIEGFDGVVLTGAAVADNFGTIFGAGDLAGYGMQMNGGESLTNGAAGHGGAVVEGFEGVRAFGTADTVTNFGTIAGAGGTAVKFVSAGDTLIVEAGCAFEGAVLGGGGTLDMDTGVGTLTGLLVGGAVTVSGSMATTTFQNFATVLVGPAATFTDSGAVTIAAGQAVVDRGILSLGGSGKASIVNAGLIDAGGAGALTLTGAVTNTGTLAVGGGTMTVNGAVTGKGVATIDGGTLDFTSSFNEAVTFTGTTGILELAQSQSYTATVSGFSKSGKTSLDLADIGFVSSSEATYSGTTKSGVLTVTDGTHTAHIALKGNYTTATFVASSDGHGGVIVVDPRKKVSVIAPPHLFIAAMAGMGDGGAGLIHGPAQPWRAGVSALAAPAGQV